MTSVAACSVEDCQSKHYGRGLCKPHWRKATYKPVKVQNLCQDCGITFETHKTCPRDRCPKCQKVISIKRRAETMAARRAAAPPKPPKPPRQLTCQHCGNTDTATDGRLKYCTDECAREGAMAASGYRNRPCKRCGVSLGQISLKTYCDGCRTELLKARQKANRKPWDRNHRSRARHYGVPHEPINRLEVFKSGGWTCGICTEPIDPAAKYPDLMSASLDHVIPMARGGGHLWSNVQPSHFICNSLKSDSLQGV